jgi:hypothetical protein
LEDEEPPVDPPHEPPTEVDFALNVAVTVTFFAGIVNLLFSTEILVSSVAFTVQLEKL